MIAASIKYAGAMPYQRLGIPGFLASASSHILMARSRACWLPGEACKKIVPHPHIEAFLSCGQTQDSQSQAEHGNTGFKHLIHVESPSSSTVKDAGAPCP